MARFDIISKDGSIIRYSGKPRYIGTYLKPSHLEFNEIASPVPIAWEVGDYVDYPRTGMRYYLYSIPQPTKKARKDTYGGAFVYSGVQFHAATKELEIAPFRDLVSNDNNIHFSTAPDVATFENVEGIARRIQACMDDLYPGRWEIRIAEFDAVLDAEIVEKISEAKDFALSGGTCLDALSRIYELWQDIGWIHSYENGKEVITIGYANKRIDANTTDSYLYGKGNGLTAIKRNQTNKDEFATRLYVYGSERNLPARYYNGLDILNAESVDIRNLMLPLDSWGVTDELPDARKAYLENAEAVAKYGVIPKTHYFDSDDAGADIYPSIEGMTIGHIRKVLADMGQSQYSPSTSIYPDDSERVDEVVASPPVVDSGIIKRDGKSHDVYQSSSVLPFTLSGETIPSGSVGEFTILNEYELWDSAHEIDGVYRAKITYSPTFSWEFFGLGFKSVWAVVTMYDGSIAKKDVRVEGTYDTTTKKWVIRTPRIAAEYTDASYIIFRSRVTISIFADVESVSVDTTVPIGMTQGNVQFYIDAVLDKTFIIRLKQIGFDIEGMASMGEGKTISMKSGMCEGRSFVISEARYHSDTDWWELTCKRQQDDTLGMLFPNRDYTIESGDRFVLLDIAMPESYIRIAMERLLAEGQKLLARASKIQSNYEPSVDAKVMMESGRTLREGMFMEISDEDVVDNGTDYILIDTLNIYEDESAIPTYKVTLRERRKVSYKGTPSATSTTSTKSVETDGDSADSVSVDLSGYYTKTEIDSKIAGIDLSPYLKSADAENTYATKTALSAVDGRLTTIETYFATSEDADTQINKWNEIVAFLNATEGTTLSSILASYYTKTEIDSKVSTINNTITGVSNRVTALETWKNDISKYITIVDGNVKISTNLIVTGDTASGGDGESSVVGISGVILNGVTYRDTDGDGLIDLGTIESGLDEDALTSYLDTNGYATQSWVEGKNYLTSHQTIHALTIKNSAGTTQLTYTPNSGAGSLTLTKAMVGLGSVENTALSTWAGSAKITTLGTITSGTWNGSKIANSYLANSAMTIAGNSVSLGGSLAVATLQSSLGLGSLAYKSSLVASDIPNLDWSKITSGKPTTLAGYGITDAITTGNIGNQSVNYATSAGSATKLATARTIWGQSFDGTGNVSGALKTPSGYNALTILDTYLVLGQGMAENSLPTYLDGYNIYMRYGNSSTIGLTLNSSGNVGIGTTSPAYKLDVAGTGRFTSALMVGGALTASSTILASSVICGTGRLRVNASDNAANFGYMRVETVSSNRGLLHIGANYGGSVTITNAGVDVDAIGIYRGVVGIGRTYTYEELYANQAANTVLHVAGNQKIDGNLVVTGDIAA